MKLYLQFDIPTVCKNILQEQLEKMDVNYSILTFGEVEIKDVISSAKLKQLGTGLSAYGIQIVETQKSILVQKIKDIIVEMVYVDSEPLNSKFSTYLASKLHHRYGYLSNLFSDITYTSIENFIILQKIERAKQLIATNDLTFKEIAWKLNYSSTAHFSMQFKSTTGITPSAFQRIINRRRNPNQDK